jgi:hypothetical protein
VAKEIRRSPLGRGYGAASPSAPVSIRKMSRDNPLCGAPRIYGEFLKLAIDIGASRPWFRIDSFTVPKVRFQVLRRSWFRHTTEDGSSIST